ncbi:MAG: TlpA family protein disulfide reductase [Blastocatellia bacterium]|nr:TlpA family protein disulfide reductase [Blastocatellia bacterium]
MRSILRFSVLAILSAIVFSSLTGCSDTASPSNGPIDASHTPADGSKTEPENKKSDYPPIAAAVAQADIKNLDGTTFKVADKKGKVILLNMWATWCGPCRAEMPSLVRMQDEHRDAGLEVIGLNTDDETVAQINDFAAEMKLNYTIVWAGTDLQTALLRISKFGGIPQSFIIDRDGNLRGVFRGANPADIKKMEELVALVVNE